MSISTTFTTLRHFYAGQSKSIMAHIAHEYESHYENSTPASQCAAGSHKHSAGDIMGTDI